MLIHPRGKIALVLGLISVGILIGGLALNQYIYQQKQDSGEVMEPYQATLEGTYVCLPHRDTSGPQTMECAYGLQTLVGEYYALDFGDDQEAAARVITGERVTLSGVITPIERLSSETWQKYDVEGILSVEGGSEDKETAEIEVTTPQPEGLVESPLRIEGRARGSWYFEGTFPVVLTDWDGLIIAEGFAQAQGEWMTEDWVPFVATVEFDRPEYGERGSLILQKDNPSGLPEHDGAYEMTVYFK